MQNYKLFSITENLLILHGPKNIGQYDWLTSKFNNMKKAILLAAVAVIIASCSAPTKLINSATYKNVSFQPVAAVFADLDVSQKKISYFMMPSNSVAIGGYDNVVATAVREALIANGDADVLIALETQVKYSSDGAIESITVSGYPAKYTNFRNPGDDYLKEIANAKAGEQNKTEDSSLLSKFKILK